MRKLLPLLLAVFTVIVLGPTAQARTVETPSAAGWRVVDGQVVWTSPTPLTGDAPVEFWSGGKLLGRAGPSRDHRTFSLPGKAIGDPSKIEVRAGGQRLDAPDPKAKADSQSPAALPPLLPKGSVDPGTPGHYQTITGEYTLDPVPLPGLNGSTEMQAVVVAPKNAPGNRPLVLFLHGRHQACYSPTGGGGDPVGWPCPPGFLPVPSYRGYLQTQQLLASQGYVTVSISADAINALDYQVTDGGAQARSSLVRLHLGHWADWAGSGRASAPQIVKDAPVADMSNVLLVGHSRGGEGVNQAALDSLAPPPFDSGYSGPVRWTIRGNVFIAPTIFGQNPTPDVPSVTLLPACDGDVSDLQGQQYIDSTRGVSKGKALHSALYIAGADHNFFNYEWTPGVSVAPSVDDYRPGTTPNPLCDTGQPARLTAPQQRAGGATYVAAAAHLFLDHDLRVQPLLDGTGVRAPSADPARVLSAALGAERTPVVIPDGTTKISGSAKLCDEIDAASACLTGTTRFKSPHAVAMNSSPTEAGRSAIDVRWSSA
ncbi:alpha/beta hydrolase family protein, partial [Kutzneria sp. 744]|uniref:alpha/beta hydrolase family protein n=1 Tax=Kutzneria sp. (strain 744) TaxID=345341 RepID=UPI0003EEA988